MEVEVKLQLADRAAHSALSELLESEGKQLSTALQADHFFDGANGELSAQQVIARVRLYNGRQRCVLCLKGKAVLRNGVSSALEEEAPLDPEIGAACAADPALLAQLDHPLVHRIKAAFQCEGLKSIGSFENTRVAYKWQRRAAADPLTLELDETVFARGTVAYELECETDCPQDVLADLEHLLSSKGIRHSHSRTTKFQKMMEDSQQ